MNIKKLSSQAMHDFVADLVATKNVIGVQSKGEAFQFAPLDSAGDLRLDYDITLTPPKQFFLPAKETLVTFDAEGKYESQHHDEPFVLLGVHPYDLVAINQMDAIFEQDNVDSHYMSRRANATIVACDVAKAAKNTFASSMGTATVSKGYDVLLTLIGDGYVAEAATKKGEAMLAGVSGAVDASEGDLEQREDVWARNEQGLNNHVLNCDPGALSKLLDDAYEHPVWEEKAKSCFGCGSCNLVCPTCYCFNVQDQTAWDLKSGQRERSWDGCLLAGFTKVAGDHEFRFVRADRLRHRLYRKGKYVPKRQHGQVACVGCGRCVDVCLTDVANPVDIYNRLLEDVAAG